ncbi:MAG: hypothetical protein IPH91_05160 [Elusimicrobia bacterium]|nr:hypothetical protein [Elusimicrobiota bacterium]
MTNNQYRVLSIGFMALTAICVSLFRKLALPFWEGMILPPSNPGWIVHRKDFGQLDIETSTVLFFNFSTPHFLSVAFLFGVSSYLLLQQRFVSQKVRLSVGTIFISSLILVWAIVECFGGRFYL